jgi:hypothetical protein
MTWSREAALQEVSHRLWRNLSAASSIESLVSTAESLFELRRGDIRRLVAAHLLLADETTAMLAAAGAALKRLPPGSRVAEEEFVGHVRGPVDWRQTLQIQLSSGDRTRFLCLPHERSFETPLSRLIAFNLQACETLLARALLRGSAGEVRRRLQDFESQVHRLSNHVKLDGVRAVLPSSRQLAALQRRPGCGPLISFAQRYRDSFEQLDRASALRVVERQLLAPSSDDALFELQVGFRVLEQLEARGFRQLAHSVIEPGTGGPLASMRRGSEEVRLWWQRSVFRFIGPDSGLYAESLFLAGLPTAPLRPDLVLEFPEVGRVVLFEIKHSRLEGSPASEGVRDALLYLMDARAHFDGQPTPHAAVVATGAPDSRLVGQRVLVGSEAHVYRIVDEILHRHAGLPASTTESEAVGGTMLDFV